jgi:hypothetical protein
MDRAEADRIRQLSRALRSFPLGPFEQVMPYAFAVVDAGLWECFISRKIVSFLTSRRQRMTTGSARYILTWREGADNFAEIQIRTVGEEATHIAIIPGTFARQNHLEEPNGIIEATLEIFIGWLNKDQLRMIEALEEQVREEDEIDALWRPRDENTVKELSQHIRPNGASQIGRPRATDNEWIRQQIQQGQEREHVFAEYLQRQEVDIEDQDAIERARDRFRKALRRTEGKK